MNLTIIGLGRIGASVGLALGARREQIRRIGHDISPETARLASQRDCVDKISHNLPDSVRQADIVLLALPLDQIEDTLRIIGQDLPSGALVLETAPAKTQVATWAQEHLPPHCAYIGLSPVLNARYLLDPERGPAAGRADLFAGSQIGLIVPPRISEGFFNLALHLVEMLGARPLFIDPQEADGVLAGLHLLPQLASAGLHAAVSRQPGWAENRKLAGGPFARSSAVLLEGDTPEALGVAASSGRSDMLRLLDALIAELQTIRGQLAGPDLDGLVAGIRRAAEGQAEWRDRREVDDWDARTDASDAQLPSWRQRLGGFFGSRRPDDGS
jgi:prephenate dehydrogenase